MKDTQGAVAKELKDFAAIFLVEGEEDTAMPGPEEESMLFVDMHEVGIPYDISKNDGCQLALELLIHDGG
jgi:hypothetical protein